MKKQSQDKFKSIELSKEDIIHEYFILKEKNVSKISRKYAGPYSTIRRFIDDQKKIRNQEDIDDEDHLNVADFPFLSVGYTYQWSDTLKMWKVVGTAIKESEEVFLLVPTKSRGEKHFICTEEVV